MEKRTIEKVAVKRANSQSNLSFSERKQLRPTAKVSVLVTCILIMLLLLFHPEGWNNIAIYAGCPWQGRMLYHFFHANILHAMLNAWCLLSLVFIYNITAARLAIAYTIASLAPESLFDTTPTVGLSAIVFFLLGSISFEVKRKAYYQAWMLFYIIVGFLFPNTNAWLHLYAYTAGLLYAILNKPIKPNTRHSHE